MTSFLDAENFFKFDNSHMKRHKKGVYKRNYSTLHSNKSMQTVFMNKF
jgi:hypothetical protein